MLKKGVEFLTAERLVAIQEANIPIGDQGEVTVPPGRREFWAVIKRSHGPLSEAKLYDLTLRVASICNAVWGKNLVSYHRDGETLQVRGGQLDTIPDKEDLSATGHTVTLVPAEGSDFANPSHAQLVWRPARPSIITIHAQSGVLTSLLENHLSAGKGTRLESGLRAILRVRALPQPVLGR